MAERTESGAQGVLASAVLVASVIAVLGAGLILSTDPPHERVAAQRPALQDPVPAAAPAPSPSPILDTPAPAPSLAARAGSDVARIGSSGGRYTAQLLVACKPETVARVLESASGARSLYVLPADVRGAACFRLCWGAYATSQEAAAAADLPASLRTAERVSAVEIVKVLP